MLLKQFLVLSLSLFITFNTFAGVIENGAFATCDYSSWGIYTDGGAGSLNDFSIQNSGSNCSAQIQVDHYASAGDPFGPFLNDAFLTNTLSQSLDFSGAETSSWLLSIDYSVDSEVTSANGSFIGDSFSFGISDGAGNYFNEAGIAGYLLDPTIIDGASSGLFTLELGGFFSNVNGLFLDMELYIGADSFGWSDAFGSTLSINEVTLTEKLAAVTSVPEPSTVLLLIAGVAGIASRRNTVKT